MPELGASLRPPAVGTLGFACTCDEIHAAEARIEALAEGMAQRCEALAQAISSLPALAEFDPLALPAAAAAKTPPTARPARRRPAPAQPVLPAPIEALVQPSVEAARKVLGALGSTVLGTGQDSRSPAAGLIPRMPFGIPGIPQGLVTAGSLAAELVGDLLARVPQPTFADALRGLSVPAPRRKAASSANPSGGSSPRPTTKRPADADATAPMVEEVLRAMQALAGKPPAATPVQGNLAAAGQGFASMVQAPALIEILLGGIAAATAGASAQTGRGKPTALAAPAPRAASRLFDAPAGEPGPTAKRPAAPSSDAPDEGGAAALAQGINRLLLDQAWLRGVDLT